jgi:hypothetical protein
MKYEKKEIQTLAHGNQDCLDPDVFQKSCLNLSLRQTFYLSCQPYYLIKDIEEYDLIYYYVNKKDLHSSRIEIKVKE